MAETNHIAGRLPIDFITVVARRNHPGGIRTECKSRPGHLLHLIEAGSYHLITNGRHYDLAEGDVIYYHDGEDVLWEPSPPVTFLTVGFFSPSLPAPPSDQRCFASTPEIRQSFRDAVRLAREPESRRRDCLLYAAILSLIGHLPWEEGTPGQVDPAAGLWWKIESVVRRRRLQRPLMQDLEAIGGRSAATITRSCHAATGLSPLRRIAAMRMEEARGLLLYSDLNVTQVAQRLGYPRMHEFSREFAKHYSHPPSLLRRRPNIQH